MQQRPLGRSGLHVSRLGLGTMTWGRDTDADEAADQLRTYLDAGGNLLDTADVFGDGDSEAVIGALLDGVVDRDELVISTKAGLRPGTPRRHDNSRLHLLRALDASLGRLGTDYVDVWHVHGHDPATPIAETLAALDTAVSSGRVRYAGVSNFNGWQTAQAAAVSPTPLISAQVEYSLLERGVEREVLGACAALGLGLLAWSPLGRGVLTGKYRHGVPSDSRGGSEHLERFVAPYLDKRGAGIVEAVATAADGLGCSPLVVALAWIRDRPGVTAPLIGARTTGQLLGALAVEKVTLPAQIRRALDDVSAVRFGYPERQS
ncbi:aldo/keto reductase [Longispora fulva]|uniref:Aryl-alcohol dehydrogenase-like predicted oxidoreductase n=1 Tax=Longispora fulva TaxID=619741 RepID=A0A8J7KU99_9ACTN|nr:aldo/keto reductase [Longispora fulva]MBG6141597.1 aryl-alcohol dehydrogenase-like predicted oxidoreductase [Longispora fulva]